MLNSSSVELLKNLSELLNSANAVSQRHIALLGCYSAMALVSVAGNSLLLLAVLRLRRVSEKYFLLNLVLTNFLMTCICIPSTCSQLIVAELGDFLCRLMSAASVLMAAASIFNHTAMILERSIGVNAVRVAVNSKEGRSTSLKMIVGVWALALLVSTPVALMSRQSDAGSVLRLSLPLQQHAWPKVCLQESANKALNVAYDACLMLLLYVIPLCVFVASYVRIIRTVEEVSVQLVKFNNSVTNRTKKIVRLAVTMAGIFAVSWLPLHLTRQVKNILDLAHSRSSVHDLLNASSSPRLLLLNNAVTFVGLSNCAVNPLYLFASCPNLRRILTTRGALRSQLNSTANRRERAQHGESQV